MKRYIRASYLSACKDAAKEVASSLWSFQNMISGDRRYSDMLSPEDVEILDKARIILDKYSEDTL